MNAGEVTRRNRTPVGHRGTRAPGGSRRNRPLDRHHPPPGEAAPAPAYLISVMSTFETPSEMLMSKSCSLVLFSMNWVMNHLIFSVGKTTW